MFQFWLKLNRTNRDFRNVPILVQIEQNYPRLHI